MTWSSWRAVVGFGVVSLAADVVYEGARSVYGLGMGRGLGVHKALDQVGAFAGPLLVAALVAAAASEVGGLQLALAALAVPGALAMVLLFVTRRNMPPQDPVPADHDLSAPHHRVESRFTRLGLPSALWRFATAAALCTAGLVTFGLISFHLVERAVVPVSGVPLLYAGAMAAGALAALVTGWVYDRLGGQILLTLPFIVAAVPPLAFGGSLAAVAVGVLLWGAAVGVQDSTVKALVAHLVKRERRATAYGVFAAVQGAGALLGGVIAGALYERSVTALVIGTAAAQAIALLLLAATVVEQRRGAGTGSR